MYSSVSQPFVHFCIPWQPISIDCTLRINKMSVINTAAVISNLYVGTVNRQRNNGLCPPLFNFFLVPLNVLVRTTCWESLM
jgi:hypothetical protein